jgi:mannose-6-phosphate isomerase-like protein (cupin superfamily)
MRHRYQESTRIAQLLAKLALKSISEIEKEELSFLLKRTGINAKEILSKVDYQIDNSDIEAEQRVWTSIEKRISKPERYKWGNYHFMRYAAAVALVGMITAGIFLVRSQHASSETPITLLATETILECPSGESIVLKENTDLKSIINNSNKQLSINNSHENPVAEPYKIKVSYGSNYIVTLEDGTTVTLYPESELVFPSSFSNKERSVTLIGEGYFNVQRDTARPFTVHAGEASIVVLGTCFNVRAYNSEKSIETALVTGKVLINHILLQPNQMAVFDKKSNQIKIEDIDASIYKDRAMGMFVFENRNLDEIMREFSMWFGFEYSFKNEDMKEKKFRFKLPHTDNFNYLMHLMEETGELQFEVSDKKVKVLPGKVSK